MPSTNRTAGSEDSARLLAATKARSGRNATPPKEPSPPLNVRSTFDAAALYAQINLPSPTSLFAVATPAFRLGDEIADRAQLQAEADLSAPSCDDFEDLKPLPETPYIRATKSRKGLSRKDAVLKLAVWHKYGGRCMVTLMSYALQLAHVIPIAATNAYLRFLEWVFGDEFGTFLIQSTRNLWLVNSNIHYLIDRGLLKIVPEPPLLEAIRRYSEIVRKQHKGKRNNKGIGISRQKVFFWNYTYWVVGILCSPELVINRHRLITPDVQEETVVKDSEEYGFRYTTFVKKPMAPPESKNDRGPPSMDAENLKPPHVHLKGYRINKKETDTLDPLQFSPQLRLQLPQCPLLVTANVGEFLWVMKNRVDARRREDANGKPFEEWSISELVEDPDIAALLNNVYRIYRDWHQDPGPAPPEDAEKSVKSKSQKASDADTSSQRGRLRPRSSKSSMRGRENTEAGPSGSNTEPPPHRRHSSSRHTQSEVEAEATAAKDSRDMPPPDYIPSKSKGKKRQVSRHARDASESRKSHRRGRDDHASTSSRSERGE
uniref:HNH nuclease domain-containing protein n=1 Tax=Moniliophthora roreri TaxID=221103 RepID=A0A0W0FIG7_MONRR